MTISNEKLNIVKHYSNSATSISYHEEKCEKIFQILIKDLALEFNSIHNIKFNDKSINIIFAHWLKRFIKICYDRYHL